MELVFQAGKSCRKFSELDFQGKKNGGIFPDWYLRVSGNEIPGRELHFLEKKWPHFFRIGLPDTLKVKFQVGNYYSIK